MPMKSRTTGPTALRAALTALCATAALAATAQAQAQAQAQQSPDASEAPPALTPPTLEPESKPDAPDEAESETGSPDQGAAAATDVEDDADPDADKAEAKPRKTREERLAEAFEKLKNDDARVRSDGEKTIARLWSQSGSPSMDLLLIRAQKAVQKEEFDEALTHLNDLVNLAPEFPEAWNARATLHYKQERYGHALSDIAQALALEPKHFGALTGLALILDGVERPKEALAAYRKALEIHPHLENAKEAVERLEKQVEGRES